MNEIERLRKERDALTERLEQLENNIKSERRERAVEGIRLLRNAMLITPKLVDVLAPTHSRTTCSDRDTNGSYVDHGVVRCPRCFLLEMAKSPTLEWMGDIVEFDISLIAIDRKD